LAIKCDSFSETEVEELMDKVREKWGGLDVLVNNAAVNNDMEPTGKCGMGIWERNIKVNLTEPFVCSKVAIGELLKKGGVASEGESGDVGNGKGMKRGVILNVVSAAGVRGFRAGVNFHFLSSPLFLLL
jgi:NAD(P)-dependent dehydrogenase (short-subunit alcohol dehydrogenase family)